MTRRSLARSVATGLLVEVRPCIYAVHTMTVTDPVLRHRNAVIESQLGRGPGWAAARRSAAVVMRLPLIGQPPTTPQLARDAGEAQSHGGDRHARVTTLPRQQRVHYDGVLLTSPARSVADIARAESFRNAVVTADGALRRGVEGKAFAVVLGEMRRWPGVGQARAALAFADGRAESPGESLARVALHAHRLPAAEPQVEIWRYGHLVARVDLLLREALLAIEFHGAIKFTDAGVLPALLERQEELRSCGLDVLNTDWDETFGHPERFARRVAARIGERWQARLAPGVELRSTVLRPVPPSLAMPWLFEERAA